MLLLLLRLLPGSEPAVASTPSSAAVAKPETKARDMTVRTATGKTVVVPSLWEDDEDLDEEEEGGGGDASPSKARVSPPTPKEKNRSRVEPADTATTTTASVSASSSTKTGDTGGSSAAEIRSLSAELKESALSNDWARAEDLLRRAASLSVTRKLLEKTGIGRTVGALSRSPDQTVSHLARALVDQWKQQIKEQRAPASAAAGEAGASMAPAVQSASC